MIPRRRLMVGDTEDDREEHVAGNVGPRRSVEVNVEVVQAGPGIDEVAVHRVAQRRCLARKTQRLLSLPRDSAIAAIATSAA